MRIAIDLTPIYDHLTGIERYNINISKEVIRQHPEDSYILVFKECVHEEFKDIVKLANVEHIVVPKCSKLFFIQWKLYKVFLHVDADYYLFLSFTSPILLRKRGIVNAIHDLTCWDCPETIPLRMKLYYRLVYQVAVNRSWKIITVSAFSQRRIHEQYRIKKEEIPVIYDGLSEVFQKPPLDNSIMKEKYSLPDEYVLSLSTIEPRKNLKLLIHAYAELIEDGYKMPKLVLAGRKGWKLDEVMGDVSEEVTKEIIFTGFVDDVDLPQLYRDARLFIFPSMYEGFGLPVIEAMSQGTLVVCSDAASLPEVAGDAGVLFISNDKENLKNAIQRALAYSEKEVQEIKDKGLVISNSFSWAREAEKLHSIMKQND